MNNTIKFGISLILFLLCFSCSKDFDDRLRGQWQLREYSHGTDQTHPDQVFYKFSRHVLFISSSQYEANGQFFQEGDSLILDLPDNETVPETFNTFGWTSTQERVFIRSLSRKKLELTQGSKYWLFRKF